MHRGVSASDCEVWLRILVDVVVQLTQGQLNIVLGYSHCFLHLILYILVYGLWGDMKHE